jgi:hypothetical protein
MDELQAAIAYFEDAIRESDEIISECSPALQKELSEQKRHFEVALEVMRRPAPENKPLTLEQLRQMNGEPVWVVFDDNSAMCALVDAGTVVDKLKLTGHWGEQIVLAEHKSHIKAIYARKPEVE